jgi:hypothetical protein
MSNDSDDNVPPPCGPIPTTERPSGEIPLSESRHFPVPTHAEHEMPDPRPVIISKTHRDKQPDEGD